VGCGNRGGMGGWEGRGAVEGKEAGRKQPIGGLDHKSKEVINGQEEKRVGGRWRRNKNKGKSLREVESLEV